jgi:hypothetical protein
MGKARPAISPGPIFAFGTSLIAAATASILFYVFTFPGKPGFPIFPDCFAFFFVFGLLYPEARKRKVIQVFRWGVWVLLLPSMFQTFGVNAWVLWPAPLLISWLSAALGDYVGRSIPPAEKWMKGFLIGLLIVLSVAGSFYLFPMGAYTALRYSDPKQRARCPSCAVVPWMARYFDLYLDRNELAQGLAAAGTRLAHENRLGAAQIAWKKAIALAHEYSENSSPDPIIVDVLNAQATQGLVAEMQKALGSKKFPQREADRILATELLSLGKLAEARPFLDSVPGDQKARVLLSACERAETSQRGPLLALAEEQASKDSVDYQEKWIFPKIVMGYWEMGELEKARAVLKRQSIPAQLRLIGNLVSLETESKSTSRGNDVLGELVRVCNLSVPGRGCADTLAAYGCTCPERQAQAAKSVPSFKDAQTRHIAQESLEACSEKAHTKVCGN